METIYLIYALLSAVFASLVAIFGKLGLKDLDANTSTAIRAVIMAVFLIAVIIVQGKLKHIEPILSNHRALLFIVLSGVAGAISWLFYFLAIQGGDIVKVVPLDRLSVVFAIVLALLFLGEKISVMTGLGAALVAVGGILVALG
jgi:bacterial/archaeal transporter family protein